MTEKSTQQPTLEEKLNELEKRVAKMESDDLPLEKALEEFEKGVGCVTFCQDLLKKAQQRIEVLTKDSSDEDSES